MIIVNKLSKGYKKKKVVIDNISFEIKSNSISFLLGKNGAGKSTLIELIASIIKPDSGEIHINNRKVGKAKNFLINQQIGIVSQHDYLINQITGYEYLTLRGLVFKIPKLEIKHKINELADFFFDDSLDIHKVISSLSLGSRMKIRIMSALLTNPQILILDEPFANLDPFYSEKLCGIIKMFAAINDNLVLISSHDLLFADRIATDILVLDNHNLAFKGTKEEFTKNGLAKIDKSLFEILKTNLNSKETISWLSK